MEVEENVRIAVSTAIKNCDKYSSACTDFYLHVDKLKNLVEQLDATTTVSRTHYVMLTHPDVAHLLMLKLRVCVQENLEKLLEHMKKLMSLRDQVRKQLAKFKCSMDKHNDIPDKLLKGSELYPPLSNLRLWIEGLFRVLNNHYESVFLWVNGIQTSNLNRIQDFIATLKREIGLEPQLSEIKSYCYYLVENIKE